jgi:proline iminopeptidase
MSAEDQAAIARAEATGDFSDPAYLAANDRFMERHCCPLTYPADAPECLTREKKHGDEAYLYGWGPNEYTPTGTLKDFEYVDRLGEIEVPSLIMSGISDLCSPLVAKTMHDGIKGSEWILWERARHTCFVDRHDEYCAELIRWMNRYDG